MSKTLPRLRWHRLAVTLALPVLLVGCGEDPASPPGGEIENQVLWNTSRRDLAKILIPFLVDPPIATTQDALPVRWSTDGYPHLTDDEERDGVVIDDDDFRIIFEIERDLDSEALWDARSPRLGWALHAHHFGSNAEGFWRTIRCYPQKGDTNFEETRVFPVRFATSSTLWFSVTIHVFDIPSKKKTVRDLLNVLRRHHGTYRQLCEQIAAHKSDR